MTLHELKDGKWYRCNYSNLAASGDDDYIVIQKNEDGESNSIRPAFGKYDFSSYISWDPDQEYMEATEEDIRIWQASVAANEYTEPRVKNSYNLY